MKFVKCVSQMRKLFRHTARYLTLVVVSIFCPLTLKFSWLYIIVCLYLNIVILAVLAFNNILLLLNHWKRCFRSWFTCLFILFKDLLPTKSPGKRKVLPHKTKNAEKKLGFSDENVSTGQEELIGEDNIENDIDTLKLGLAEINVVETVTINDCDDEQSF